jgi:hypothetical protein
MICDQCARQSSCIVRQMGERSPNIIALLGQLRTCDLHQPFQSNTPWEVRVWTQIRRQALLSWGQSIQQLRKFIAYIGFS